MATKTPVAIAWEQDSTAATAALERADAKELHVLFQRAQQRYDDMDAALTNIVSHYVGSKEVPHYTPSNENAIAAMERVALDALALARYVVEQVKGNSGKPEERR